MKSVFRRTGVFLLTLIMVFSLGISAFAIDEVRETDNPLIVFENLREPQPDLYITKTVTSALDGYSVPSDATFTFVLKWDQDGDGYLEFADSVNYFVYNANGTQVWNELTSDGSFQTSSTGRFTLQNGQYAYFEFAGTVEYEITELEQDGYIQTTPSGGLAATGTIDAEGTIVDFENLYIPEITETETTMLAVQKDIKFPEGYEETGITVEFTFSLKLDNEWYGNQPYTIYNEGMTETIEQRTTESDGTFTVPMNCVAVFDEIEVGIDYQVAEIDDDDGWQIVGTTEYHGSTVGPIIYTYFTNEPTYLVVEKQRTDGITGIDDEFTFTLTDSTGLSVSDTEYVVYDLKGNVVRTDVTDENGQFILKAGERALFIGFNEGESYTVTENSADGYNTDTRKLTEEARFENDEIGVLTNEQLTNLTVKKLDRNTGKNLLGDAEFSVYTLKNGKDVDSATEDDWEFYIKSITTNNEEDSDDYGSFTLTDLQPGTYKIVETKAPDGYTISGEPIIITLPFTMTEEGIIENKINTESSEFTGIWSEQDNCYYFYEITYDVYNNMSVMELPNAASTTLWPFVAVGAGIVAAVIVGTTIYRKRHTPKKVGGNT